MRRDVHVLNRANGGPLNPGLPAYTVIQFFTNNPGVWPLHCHLAWHNSAGFFTNFMVKQEEIAKYQIPDSIAQTCANWNAYQSVVNKQMTDSGV
jgi:hypothetical protein